MKTLAMVLILVMLSACAKSGGGGAAAASAAPPHVPDNTPHTYVVNVVDLEGSMGASTIHQVCNFGLPGQRITDNAQVLNQQGVPAGAGCTAASNYTADVVNTGANEIYFEIYIDDVWHSELEKILPPAQTYTFQRGF